MELILSIKKGKFDLFFTFGTVLRNFAGPPAKLVFKQKFLAQTKINKKEVKPLLMHQTNKNIFNLEC